MFLFYSYTFTVHQQIALDIDIFENLKICTKSMEKEIEPKICHVYGLAVILIFFGMHIISPYVSPG